MHETLNRSALGSLCPGSPVNLERAMAADGDSGAHRSSQISKPSTSSGRFSQVKICPAPKGTASWPQKEM